MEGRKLIRTSVEWRYIAKECRGNLKYISTYINNIFLIVYMFLEHCFAYGWVQHKGDRHQVKEVSLSSRTYSNEIMSEKVEQK